MARKKRSQARDWLENAALRTLIGGLLILPYRVRVPLCGWVMSRVIAPLAGYRKRIRDNLALVLPDLPAEEVERLVHRVPNNAGRSVIESYSGAEFMKRAGTSPVTGPGLAAVEEAHAAKRPIIFLTGHFGNYEASRAAMTARGYTVGVLYRPMNNRYFNTHYVAAMEALGTPAFPRGRQGLGGMLRHLRAGGKLGMLIDLHMYDGEPLTFFGKKALTALSAAELAIKYNALLVPTYAIRQDNGLDFEILMEAPVPHTDPVTMTQALNDSLEDLVRKHLDQWFWIHRRWKKAR
ncbi:lysophospholipid acyltransferase family protein [Falsirhodobacter algicola]|uniref:Lauroyl acyltransferase n=1 Tax=Falsirhodobacter algicola TaxID=2692330 RepID=A0A8J8MS10_9RHOB|nr:lysophospholipid acyltransferase family protein [Falsirhodobacter algicola]QUS35316.1 lauroyl acyltransferase [Falsirhodobacter algicola]